jgi:DNA-binding MarR family transcriptional regulator
VDDQVFEAAQAIRRTILAMEQWRSSTGPEHGLGQTDVLAIGYLVYGRGQTPAELSAKLSVASSTVTEMVDRLERIGLAERMRNPNDRRSIIVVPTEDALKIVHGAFEYLAGAVAEAMYGTTEYEWNIVTEFLRKLSHRLQQ